MERILHGYSIHQIDGLNDLLWFILTHDIEILDALEILQEEAKKLHRLSGLEKFQARLEHAARLPKKSKDRKRIFREAEKYAQRELKIIGLCVCGGTIRGLPVSACEKVRSDRVFYKECDTCDYWCEVIEVEKNVFKENSEI